MISGERRRGLLRARRAEGRGMTVITLLRSRAGPGEGHCVVPWARSKFYLLSYR
jgi:hypothetical protein